MILESKGDEETKNQDVAMDNHSERRSTDIKEKLYPARDGPQYDISVHFTDKNNYVNRTKPANKTWFIRFTLVRYIGGSCALNTKRDFGEGEA
jgi:hypothetical protein